MEFIIHQKSRREWCNLWELNQVFSNILTYDWKKWSLRSVLRLFHFSMFLAKDFVISGSSCDIRNMNLSLSVREWKAGYFPSRSHSQLLRDPYSWHVTIKCCSSSISFWHQKHVLFALGIGGLLCLPSSIISLWSETLSFVLIKQSFLLNLQVSYLV